MLLRLTAVKVNFNAKGNMQCYVKQLAIIGRGWAKFSDLTVASRSLWLRQIIDLRDTDKLRYFARTEFNNCFILKSPSLLLQRNSLYRAVCFANFEGILGFSVPSIILADLFFAFFLCTNSKDHGLWFVIGGFWSVFFASCFKVRCFVIFLFRAIID